MGEIRRMPKPVIAAVHGYALGAGCDVSMACDFRIVADNARFGLVFVRRGITGGTWMIQKHIGLAKATELLFTGEQFDATTAQQLGLVTKLVPLESLEEESLAFAAKMAAGPTKAIGFIKAALNRGMNVDVDQGMELNIAAQTLASQTEDSKEGRAAFQQRRDPVFQGR
jgi:enoyl-CoA hydratase/carnithine racemase